MLKFNENFIFGAATAAFQAEGAAQIDGRGPCYWDEYLHRPQSSFNGDVASDFYHKYRDDIESARSVGLNGIRISIAWSRIFPNNSNEINVKGIEFYNNVIDECLRMGVEPYVTLHHFDTPLYLFKQGDWLNQETITQFVNFARVCFENFGDRVQKWITINESWSVVAGQYIVGHFPPNIKYDIPKAVQAMHNMVVAHAKAVVLYKSLNLNGEIGIIHILESKYPISDSSGDVDAARLEDVLANQFMLDACLSGEYKAATFATISAIVKMNAGNLEITDEDKVVIKQAATLNDFLGLNYYASHFLAQHNGDSQIVHNGTGKVGTSIFALKGVGKRVHNPLVPTTDWDWPIFPQGLFDMLVRIKHEYPNYKKIYVTENGMGYKDDFINGKIDDTPRINYIKEHLDAVMRAIEVGVNVQGYFLWSLMDVLSWTNGFNKRYGLFYVDFDTQVRYAKKSALWMSVVSKTKKLINPEEVIY